MDLDLPKKRVFEREAGIFKRLVSFAVDIFFINMVILSPLLYTLRNIPDLSFSEYYIYFTKNPDIVSGMSSIFGVICILIFGYFVLFDYVIRQTPGKMVFGLYLIKERKIDKITLRDALIR